MINKANSTINNPNDLLTQQNKLININQTAHDYERFFVNKYLTIFLQQLSFTSEASKTKEDNLLIKPLIAESLATAICTSKSLGIAENFTSSLLKKANNSQISDTSISILNQLEGK